MPTAGVGIGPEVTAFIRPEGYLVTRFIEGEPVSLEQVHRPETLRRVADSVRRIHGGPAIPGLFVPLRMTEEEMEEGDIAVHGHEVYPSDVPSLGYPDGVPAQAAPAPGGASG